MTIEQLPTCLVSPEHLCASLYGDVCDAIVQVVLPKYIQTTHGERLQSIVDGFVSK